MSYPASQNYLDSKVLTASQPRLQLMLLDGALRFGRRAEQAGKRDDSSPAWDEPVNRLLEIVEELTHAAAAGSSDLSKPLEDQYAAIYSQLARCRLERDVALLGQCLELLEFHRETWKLACEKIDVDAVSNSSAQPGTPHTTPEMPHEGFSVEA